MKITGLRADPCLSHSAQRFLAQTRTGNRRKVRATAVALQSTFPTAQPRHQTETFPRAEIATKKTSPKLYKNVHLGLAAPNNVAQQPDKLLNAAH